MSFFHERISKNVLLASYHLHKPKTMWIRDIRPIREIHCEIKRNEKGRGKGNGRGKEKGRWNGKSEWVTMIEAPGLIIEIRGFQSKVAATYSPTGVQYHRRKRA